LGSILFVNRLARNRMVPPRKGGGTLSIRVLMALKGYDG
jgi:hypothetical protein